MKYTGIQRFSGLAREHACNTRRPSMGEQKPFFSGRSHEDFTPGVISFLFFKMYSASAEISEILWNASQCKAHGVALAVFR